MVIYMIRKNKKQQLRMSDSSLKSFVEKNGIKSIHNSEDEELKNTLLKLGIPEKFFKVKKKKENKTIIENPISKSNLENQDKKNELTPVKKQINKFKVIMESLNSCKISTHLEQDTNNLFYSCWFSGARVLTLNELFSTLQSRKYEVFIYKKKWKLLIKEAVQMNNKVPLFNGPTRIYLYRRGKRLIDLDSFQTIFKYAIDGLRHEGVLPEDNPNIVVEIIPIQEKGEPAVGIRLERLYEWEDKKYLNIFKEWFNKEE